jgi:hypothetical protein
MYINRSSNNKKSYLQNTLNQLNMKASKRISTGITAFLMLIFLLPGCQIFTAASKKLNLYCPGLKIGVSGINWSANGGRSVYVLTYNSNEQKKVQDYFENKANGFAEEKNGDFYGIEIDNEPVIDRNDNILGKTIEESKVTAEVVLNESTRKIIIIEEVK